MNKKKVLSILSFIGLSGSLMFSVSALSADSISDTSFAGGSPISLTVPGCDNGQAVGNKHCNDSSDD